MNQSQHLVDIDFALSQLGGNSDLLSRMLKKFSDDFYNIPQQVIHALDKGDEKEAKLHVHTTKGLSGNLGLIALYECSKALDLQLRNGQIEPALLAEFTSIMQDTCEFIKTINLDTKPQQDFSDSASSKNEVEKNKFLDRLKHNEFIDDETLFTYINALALDETQKKTLSTLVEDLKYTQAIELINKYS